MAIRIKIKQCFKQGVKGVEILEVEALGKDDLPLEYLESTPRVYKKKKKNLIFYPPIWCKVFPVRGMKNYYIGVGRFYDIKTFDKIMSIISEASSRLKKINDRIREEEKKWNRETVLVFRDRSCWISCGDNVDAFYETVSDLTDD